MRVLSIGEVLWDVIAEREFLGGAPLNVCVNLKRLGDEAVLVSALGRDERGRKVFEQMEDLDLDASFLQVINDEPTAIATASEDAVGEYSFSILRPAAFDMLQLTNETIAKIVAFRPDWLYMGTLLQSLPAMEDCVNFLRRQMPGIRCFYDVNLRQGHWNLALVKRLSQQASIFKLNGAEAAMLARQTGAREPFSPTEFCRGWAEQFGIDTICITLGPEGCFIYTEGKGEQFLGQAIRVSDTVGAGDAFSAAFLHGYHRRWPMVQCASFANALGALVASRSGATPVWTRDECDALAPEPQSKP